MNNIVYIRKINFILDYLEDLIESAENNIDLISCSNKLKSIYNKLDHIKEQIKEVYNVSLS